jgi:hypothetical protein
MLGVFSMIVYMTWLRAFDSVVAVGRRARAVLPFFDILKRNAQSCLLVVRRGNSSAG